MLLKQSYLIPRSAVALSEQTRMRALARDKAKELLAKKLVMGVEALTARAPNYPVDFLTAAQRVPVAGFPMSGWMTQPLAAPAVNYSMFADNTGAAAVPQVPTTQAWVFYGIHVLTLNDPVTQLFFLAGAAGQDRWAQFDLETLYDCLETQAYFSEPVVYGPQEFCTIQVTARLATGAGCRVVLDTFIVEPR